MTLGDSHLGLSENRELAPTPAFFYILRNIEKIMTKQWMESATLFSDTLIVGYPPVMRRGNGKFTI